MRIDSIESVKDLLTIESSEHLESWLKNTVNESVLEDERYWHPVGDNRSNSGAIEQSADEINPLVERIVNGMEAVIELRVSESGAKPLDPREAIELLFDVPQGKARLLDEATARQLAKSVVTVTLRGARRDSDPTIEVRDFGLGIRPEDFAQTILALGQSDKGQKPYLIGMHGQGGSSTFDKCDYTIILSRRHPNHQLADLDDTVGWTVVRRELNVRAAVYRYLIDPRTNCVPSFSGCIGDQIELNHGTLVAHVGYKNLGGFATQKITNNAFYTLNYRLFDPLLPWTLIDRRQGIPVSRTMRGVPYRVGELPEVSGIGSMEARQRTEATAVRHHSVYRHDLPSGSKLKVEWWILQDEQVREGRRRRRHSDRLRPYRDQSPRNSRRVIAITRGGQTHMGLTTRDTFRKKQLTQVARSIIVQVDTDYMSWEELASFFTSNRASLKTASQDQVEEAINSAIYLQIDQLRAIERERQEELIAGRGASDEEAIRQHLDPMILAFQRSRHTSGSSTGERKRCAPAFRGLRIPTYLRFARTTPLRVYPGVPTRVDLLTDAADDVVRDWRTDLRVQSNNGSLLVKEIRGDSGRWHVSLFPAADLVAGTQIHITASISQASAWHLDAQQPCRVVVAAPPPPYEGSDPPTYIKFRSQNGAVHIRQGGSRITIESDARDDVLSNGAVLSIVSPEPEVLPVTGSSEPRNGEFRVKLKVPEDAPVASVGEVMAFLRLPDGSELDDIARLVVDAKLEDGGTTDIQSQPNYEIRDVEEVPAAEGTISWSEMSAILDGSNSWIGEDVGAFLKTGEEGQRKITFYLNADNRELRNIERRIARRRSEAAVDTFREMHRTLLCFHLYRLAADETQASESDYSYRDEMIRVGQTLLYTHSEFLEQINAEMSE